jgi:hypothetical protein
VTDRASLADRLALELERGPAPGSRLALILGVRKQVVLRELREARRFEMIGRGSTSSWRLVGTGWEPTGRVARPEPDPGVTLELRETLDAILARLTSETEKVDAILARLSGIEERLDRLDPAPANADRPLAGQITVDEVIAATNSDIRESGSGNIEDKTGPTTFAAQGDRPHESSRRITRPRRTPQLKGHER